VRPSGDSSSSRCAVARADRPRRTRAGRAVLRLATPGRATRAGVEGRCASVIHVGLNLVYLVPGETGGMETYARELIPRLASLEGLRLTAFVNREAIERRDWPWEDLVPTEMVPVKARNRFEWARGEQQHLPRQAAAAGCDL